MKSPSTLKKIISFLMCGVIGAGFVMIIASLIGITVPSTALLAGIFGLPIVIAIQEWCIPAIKRYWRKQS
ncbi:MAG: hypothetical protein ACHQVS_02625 [Candidatus Babeliales bacterium]